MIFRPYHYFGQELDLGNTRVKVLHTPGHTPESVCLLVTDLRRSTEPWFVLTGDTLFVGAVGRPDQPGRARENAAELYDSIQRKLLTLPEEIEIFPGHFAGSEFVAAIVEVPPKPEAMTRILSKNRGRAETGS
jgi:hydroxyacylglutathione hydrolase